MRCCRPTAVPASQRNRDGVGTRVCRRGVQFDAHQVRPCQHLRASCREVQDQADRIVETAREEAARAAEDAKADLQKSIARRLAAAEDQIASAEASAVKEVRDQAVVIAVAAAREVIEKQMSAAQANKLIDDAISEVDAKLH